MKLLWDQWHNLPETVVRQRQAARLQTFLREAVLPFSAHYQKIFRERNLTIDSIQSLDDLVRLPFTTKTGAARNRSAAHRGRGEKRSASA